MEIPSGIIEDGITFITDLTGSETPINISPRTTVDGKEIIKPENLGPERSAKSERNVTKAPPIINETII